MLAKSYLGARNLYVLGIGGQRVRVETNAVIDAAEMPILLPMESIRVYPRA